MAYQIANYLFNLKGECVIEIMVIVVVTSTFYLAIADRISFHFTPYHFYNLVLFHIYE